jgi:hypothetical protein
VRELIISILEHLSLATVTSVGALGVLLLPVILPCLLLGFLAGRIRQAVMPYGVPGMALFGWLGIPLHEFFHTLPLILTGQGPQIGRVELGDVRPQGFMGMVAGSTSNWNPLKTIGAFLCDYTPLFGGVTVMVILTRLLIPKFTFDLGAAPGLPLFDHSVAFAPSRYLPFIGDLARYVVSTIRDLIGHMDFTDPRTWLYLYLVFSISQHMTPSYQDVRVSWWSASLLLLILILLNAVVLFFSFDPSAGVLALLAGPMAVLASLLYFGLVLTLIAMPFALLLWVLAGGPH